MLYRTEPLSDLLQVVPPPYLIDGLIRKNTITLFSSEPHTGKSMIMLYLALCMEHGKQVFDTFDVSIRTSSIYIAMDSPRWDIASQIQKLSRGLGLTPGDIAMMDSRILCRGTKPKPNVMDAGFVDWLKELSESYQIDTIFIDTLRRVHHRNENASEDMSEVMERLEAFVDQGRATIIMATHTSKGMGFERSSLYSVRGSTVIPGSADFHYSLSLDKNKNIVFDGTSKRRGENRSAGHITLAFRESNNGLRIELVDQPDEPTAELVFKELLTGPKTAQQLVPATGGSYHSVQKALKKLSDAGRVRRIERGVWSLCSYPS
jgi:RecA-family ATPase